MTTLTSVPGQFSTGYLDGLYRDNPGDGTLGQPDFSPVPYTHTALLEPVSSSPQWALGPVGSGWGAFKGSPGGLGALRNSGSDNGSARIEIIPQNTGLPLPTGGLYTPDSIWGVRDFAVAVRNSGGTWDGSRSWAYIRFTQSSNSAQIWMTTGTWSSGPWDAKGSDQPAITLPSGLTLWDGNPHTFHVSQLGSLIFCLVDGKWPLVFNNPSCFHFYNPSSWVQYPLPTTGPYIGCDWRGTSAVLYAWEAMAPGTGDAFYWNPTTGTTAPPPGTTYTPATAASGETWTCSGSVTASSSGVSLGASSTAFLTPANAAPNAVVSTRFNSVAASGGLVLKRKDASNYLLLTPTQLLAYNNGTLLAYPAFSSAIPVGADVVVTLGKTSCTVAVNGASMGSYSYSGLNLASYNQLGFLSPSGATSSFRYVAYQPLYTQPVLPTT